MAKKSKAIVKSSTVLTGSVSKARKELVLRGLTALSKGSEEKLSKPKIITLRSSYKTLSVSEVQSMANVSIRENLIGDSVVTVRLTTITTLKP
mgnify:CR=1 FL=1